MKIEIEKEKIEDMLQRIIDIRAAMEHDYIETTGTIETTRPDLFIEAIDLEDIIAEIAGDEDTESEVN